MTIVSIFNVRWTMKSYWKNTFMQYYYPTNSFNNILISDTINRSVVGAFLGFFCLSIAVAKSLFSTDFFSLYFIFTICLLIPFAFTIGLVLLLKPDNTEYTNEQKELEQMFIKSNIKGIAIAVAILYFAGIFFLFKSGWCQ